jgi:hypothetical protein
LRAADPQPRARGSGFELTFSPSAIIASPNSFADGFQRYFLRGKRRGIRSVLRPASAPENAALS